MPELSVRIVALAAVLCVLTRTAPARTALGTALT